MLALFPQTNVHNIQKSYQTPFQCLTINPYHIFKWKNTQHIFNMDIAFVA